MAQKKIMLLGGLRYLKPVIDAAHKQGYYVITADYLPNNIAHKWSDEYCNVSIIDKEAVLREAQRLQIDGIMSFACDPGVVAASYVQNKMGLPSFGPFESVEILQNKDKFRAFLAKNGFNVPQAKGFDSVEAAMEEIYWYPWPVIVKPTDAAGSKGVTRVDKSEDLRPALEYAMEHSISTPAAYSWPSTFTKEQEEYLTSEIQRLITLLNLKTCVYNIEVRVAPNGKPYIMELTPRGGGNRLCEMLRYATGVDMITAITRAMVGDPILEPIEQKPYNGHWAEIILHADKDGVFEHLEISKELPAEIVEEDLWVVKGDKVEGFEGANNAIGTLVLKFQTAEELEKAITNQRNWLKVVVK